MSVAAAQEHIKSALQRIHFSVPSFLHGLGAGIGVLALATVWMALRADDTLLRQQANMPSKTAVIERIESEQAPPPETVAVQETTQETTPNALARAPVEGLYETTPVGQVPVANLQTGQTPFDTYKRPVTLIPGRAPVALIFLGGGLSESLSTGIIDDLPPDVAIALSPYAKSPGTWMEKIRAAGHEVWLTLPLQNTAYPDPDPGPHTILHGVSPEQNQDRLMRVLASGTGYAGLISLDDHDYTAENTDIIPIIQQIFGRGLGFIDGRPDRPFFGADIATAQSYPYADTSMTIGEDLAPASITALLSEIEKLAQMRGQMIVYVHPTPANIRGVAEWIKTVDERGVQIVPPSALVKQ